MHRDIVSEGKAALAALLRPAPTSLSLRCEERAPRGRVNPRPLWTRNASVSPGAGRALAFRTPGRLPQPDCLDPSGLLCRPRHRVHNEPWGTSTRTPA